MTTEGGAADFSEVIAICRSLGPYCLIGGLAVNCYVEPVYTLDADFVLIPGHMAELPARINARRPSSQLRIQFTTDPRYLGFPGRAREQIVLGESVAVACLEDVFRGKIWAWSDPARRMTKRKKDELDLLRLADAHPALRAELPESLRSLLE